MTDVTDDGPLPEVTVVATQPQALQYLRQVSVIIGTKSGKAIELKDFRVTFTIKRGDIQTPNTADVRIYNLSSNTANTIAQPEFNRLQIQAGYENNFGLIFRGTVKQFRKGRLDQKDS